MKRTEIQQAAKDHFRGLDYPEPNEMADFAIEIINRILEDFERDVEHHDGWGVVKTDVVLKKIRALKIT